MLPGQLDNWLQLSVGRHQPTVSMQSERCLAQTVRATVAPVVICGDLDHILD